MPDRYRYELCAYTQDDNITVEIKERPVGSIAALDGSRHTWKRTEVFTISTTAYDYAITYAKMLGCSQEKIERLAEHFGS